MHTGAFQGDGCFKHTTTSSIACTKQTNSHDCGFWVLQNIKLILDCLVRQAKAQKITIGFDGCCVSQWQTNITLFNCIDAYICLSPGLSFEKIKPVDQSTKFSKGRSENRGNIKGTCKIPAAVLCVGRNSKQDVSLMLWNQD